MQNKCVRTNRYLFLCTRNNNSLRQYQSQIIFNYKQCQLLHFFHTSYATGHVISHVEVSTLLPPGQTIITQIIMCQAMMLPILSLQSPHTNQLVVTSTFLFLFFCNSNIYNALEYNKFYDNLKQNLVYYMINIRPFFTNSWNLYVVFHQHLQTIIEFE